MGKLKRGKTAMDWTGLIRRYVGAAGVILVAFGLWDQGQADAAVSNISTVAGGLMYLIDLVMSTVNKVSK
jgi:hypothetical protein